ncbi:MAG TPA: decaprenyl-phosphate phosphoribosyltransferase [Gemmatimonadaceae bacterium]|nr:decaprenyl-phosphate phosphoribosyltransferase [Gemmatimonadaceae bacterium]
MATVAGVRSVSVDAVVRLLRPRQWVKNAFVLAPLIFSGSFVHPRAVGQAAMAVALFCIASSATYVFNDLIDRADDARHPIKSRTRPIASGEIRPGTAVAILGVLVALLAAAFLWNAETAAVALAYCALNVAYTLKLKRVPVVDLFALAAGFVMRVYAGAVVLDVPLSSWMMVTTLSLALYLAAIKRRDELVSAGDASRSVLKQYSLRLLDRYAEMAALSAMVFYGLFVVTVRPKLNVTLPFVLFGLFRYWFVVETGGRGESPTDAVWSDWLLIATVVAWAAVCVWRLWGVG